MCFENFWPPKHAWQSRNLKRFEILQNLVDLYALHAAFYAFFPRCIMCFPGLTFSVGIPYFLVAFFCLRQGRVFVLPWSLRRRCGLLAWSILTELGAGPLMPPEVLTGTEKKKRVGAFQGFKCYIRTVHANFGRTSSATSHSGGNEHQVAGRDPMAVAWHFLLRW